MVRLQGRRGNPGLPREWLARMVPQEEAGGQEGKGENLPGGPSLAAGLSGWAMEKRHETRRDSFHVFVFLSDSTWINAPWQGRCP